MRTLILSLAALAIATLATPANAQDSSIFQLFGLGGEDKPEIDYRERAPLVVPPTMTLPEPAEFSASEQANWPKDPDALRRKRIAANKAKPQRQLTGPEAQLQFIRQEQAKKARKVAQGKGKQGGLDCVIFGGCVEPDAPPQGVAGEQLSATLANGEPRRRYLTDPPVGVRAPAPGGTPPQ
jgi:hypothetical protein